MINRWRCWMYGHVWPDWPVNYLTGRKSSWWPGGEGRFYRMRFCKRCSKQELEIDR